MFKPIFLFMGLLILTSLVFAATCAQKSYSASCTKCKFDQNGKMDQACYEGYQTSGKACLFGAYPLESIQYSSGNCPAIDVCVDRLQTCKAMYSTRNDQLDCDVGQINHCFIRGDACVAKAVQNCSGTPPDELIDLSPPAGWCDGFFYLMIPLFVGVFYYKKR